MTVGGWGKDVAVDEVRLDDSNLKVLDDSVCARHQLCASLCSFCRLQDVASGEPQHPVSAARSFDHYGWNLRRCQRIHCLHRRCCNPAPLSSVALLAHESQDQRWLLR